LIVEEQILLIFFVPLIVEGRMH
jgi:hypothetical protein